MVFILSGPPVSAPVPANQWESISVVWIGQDGSEWDLAAGTEGVVLQADGTEGLHDPVLTKYSSVSRAVAGKRLRGWRTEARDVFWPLKMYADNSDLWRDTYGRFFRSISPDRPGVWRVGYKGDVRELSLTGVYERSHAFETHPTVIGWGNFALELEAAQPYWTGAPISAGPWAAANAVDFFHPSGSPDFRISESSALGSVTMSNPGDVAAFPVWKVTGPLSSVELGVGDLVIDVPFTVATGEVLIIDTDPRNVTATLDGDDATADLGFQRFAPIPPGESVPIHVEGTGAGNVSCTLVPLYFRAF